MLFNWIFQLKDFVLPYIFASYKKKTNLSYWVLILAICKIEFLRQKIVLTVLNLCSNFWTIGSAMFQTWSTRNACQKCQALWLIMETNRKMHGLMWRLMTVQVYICYWGKMDSLFRDIDTTFNTLFSVFWNFWILPMYHCTTQDIQKKSYNLTTRKDRTGQDKTE